MQTPPTTKYRVPAKAPAGQTAASANTKLSPKKPNHVDNHVAGRLRLRRVMLGLSQDDLAKRLGVTSQQVQKYEAGETRISASRLYEIAQHLGVPITWFFSELEEADAEKSTKAATPARPDVSDLLMRRETRDLVEAYFSISDVRLRKKLLQMADLLTKPQLD